MKNIAKYIDEGCCGKRNNINYDTLKAYKKRSREEEIEMFGKPINHSKVFRNKKQYTRKDKHKNKF